MKVAQGLSCVLSVFVSCGKKSSGRETRTDNTGQAVIYMVQHLASKVRVHLHDAESGLKVNWGLG